MSDNNGTELKLKRTMGFWGLVFFGVVFMNPGAIFYFFGMSQIVSKGHSTIVFIVGATAVFLTAQSYAKMIQVYPDAGSAYAYTSNGINPKLGFLVGWTMLLDYVLTPMFILTFTGLYMYRTFPVLPGYAWMILIAGGALAMNIIGLKLEEIFNVGAIVFQIGIVGSVAVLSVIYLANNGTDLSYSQVFYNSETFDMRGTVTVATLSVLSFLGFDGMSTLAEESKIEPKVVAKSIKTAVLIQGICLISLAYVCSLLFSDYTKILNPDTFSYDLFTKIGGENYNYAVIAAQTFLAFMGMIAATTASSRLLYSMGRSNVIPKQIFGKLSKRYNTPANNCIIIMVLCIIGGLIFDWTIIAEIVAFGAMFGFICVNLAVINQFYFKNKEKKVFSNLIMPLLGFLAIAYVMYSSSTLCKTVGVAWLACGVIYLVVRSAASKSFRETISRGLDIK